MLRVGYILLIFIICNISYCQTVNPEDVFISYKCLNTPLPIVLKELSQKSKVDIVFSSNKIKNTKTLTFEAKNQRLVDVLTVILKKYRLTFDIISDKIVITSPNEKERYLEFTISGYIRDKNTKEPLPHCAIYLSNKENGTYSNDEGFYTFKLRRNTYNFVYSYIGYDDDSIRIFLKRDTIVDLYLNNSVNTIEEVIIKEDLNKSMLRFGEDYISRDKILNSNIGGESDVLRALYSSSDVTSGADGFGGLSIRGGNTDQNMILYDGVPLQNTGHAFGLISLFNTDMITDARLYKTSIPARYSGRLSSVFDIKTRSGNQERFKGEFGISTIAVKGLLEGPIVKNKSSFIISARRTFADIWIKRLSSYINSASDATGQTNFIFSDINTKFKFKLGEKSDLSILLYTGGDELNSDRNLYRNFNNTDYKDQSITNNTWNNRMASIHFNTQLSKNAYSKIIAYYTNWKTEDYKFDRKASDSTSIKIVDIYTSRYLGTRFGTYGIRWDLSKQFSKNYLLRGGIGSIYNEFYPSLFNQTNNNKKIYPDSIEIGEVRNLAKFIKNNGTEFNGYVENEIQFGRGLVLNLGLHGSTYTSDTSTFNSLQPRFSLNINQDHSWATLAITFLRQYQQSINEDGFGLPSDFWLSTTKYIKPADGINFGVNAGLLLNKSLSMNVGGYYKTMKNIISLGEGETLNLDDFSNDRWQRDIPRGKGQSYGADLGLYYTSDATNFEIIFGYLNSSRNFPDFNNGKVFSYKFERRYTMSSNFDIRLSKKLKMNLFGTYQDGANISMPNGGIFEFNLNGKEVIAVLYDQKNGFKLPNYFRLDANLFYNSKTKKGNHTIQVGVYNLTNQKNPIYLRLDRNTLKLNSYVVKQVSIFPLLPSISYKYGFN